MLISPLLHFFFARDCSQSPASSHSYKHFFLHFYLILYFTCASILLQKYLAQELKTTSTLAVCAMLAALALILNSVASINIGPYVKIGFSGIPNQIADYLFGPITGCLFAGVLDIVKFFIRPDGPFFFRFTFNAMLAAFIYGCFYYKHKLTFRRVLIAKLVVVLIVNVLLNTLWLDLLYGKGFLAILPMRTVKNLIMWPIDSFIFFTITRLIEQTGIFNLFRKQAINQL